MVKTKNNTSLQAYGSILCIVPSFKNNLWNALKPQYSGENSANILIDSGMTNTGTQIPPKAARIMTDTAPKVDAC